MATRPILVQKFGGTSVGSVARIHHVASLALAAQRSGYDVVVVVSAMSGETNRLLALADEVAAATGRRERDALAASGEQASAALTAIAIQAAGGKSRTFLGHQIPIVTDSHFGDARVLRVAPERLRDSLARGEVPVVAGFQGVSEDGHITTLGRGGSDTTAVAVAAALNAQCDIYTDVDGVYTADPNIVSNARKLREVSYQLMLTFASLGAKVLHDRCIELAQKSQVPVQVRTSFGDVLGTMIVPEGKDSPSTLIGGCALDRKLMQIYASPEAAPKDLENCVEMIQSHRLQVCDYFRSQERPAFMIRDVDSDNVRKILSQEKMPILCFEPTARVSMVGRGLLSNKRIQSNAENLLKAFGISVMRETLSDSFVSYYVRLDQAEEALRVLHDGMSVGIADAYSRPSRPGRRRS